MAPISELRGAIPTGIAMGLPPLVVFIISIIFNSLIVLPIYFGLIYFYKHIKKVNIISRYIEKARQRGHKPMEKYGVWGLLFFVAIPFPLTGAWTGTIIAWLFDVEWWKSLAIISIGVIIAGIVIMLSTLGVARIW
jgi:uncharacterized membrane protein